MSTLRLYSHFSYCRQSYQELAHNLTSTSIFISFPKPDALHRKRSTHKGSEATQECPGNATTDTLKEQSHHYHRRVPALSVFKALNKKIQVKRWFCQEVQKESLLTTFPSHATALSTAELCYETVNTTELFLRK